MRGSFHGRALGALALCLILASTLTTSGCGHGKSILPGLRWENGGSKATEAELDRYAQAAEALEAGRYGQAADLFNDIFVATEDMELAGRARYGHAVALLGAARGDGELRKAWSAWDGWSRGWPNPEVCPDPRLMEPLVRGLSRSNARGGDAEALELRAEELARQLEEARRENEDMRAKIRALEELHQDMQRRQKKLISQ